MSEVLTVVKLVFRDGFEKELKNVTIEPYGVKGEAWNAKDKVTEVIRVPWDALKLVSEAKV